MSSLPRATTIPKPWRSLQEEIDARIARIPTRLNEYGFDAFGLEPSLTRWMTLPMVWVYRNYLRVQTRGIERVPEGPVLLIANHAGNTFAWDAAMLAVAMLLEAEPPRIVRGMGEYWLPTVPWVNELMVRGGSVVGTRKNCVDLLNNEEAVIAFPEGVRGMNKLIWERYQLQEFGHGFMRLALETGAPIVPIAVVGSEEQAPGIANLRPLARLLRMPAFPITLTFPALGLLGLVPLPVKYNIYFGEPMHFEGDADEDDAAVERRVEEVRAAISGLLKRGLAERTGVFR